MSGIQELSIDGKKYFITFIDDFSRYCWIHFTPHKDAKTIRDIYEIWRADAENKAGEPVSYLQTDVGGEYQKQMAEILKTSGVTHLKSPPYSHESNGLAERQNRTFKDTARTLLHQAHLPSSFWTKAVQAACQIRNRLPHSALHGSIRTKHSSTRSLPSNIFAFSAQLPISISQRNVVLLNHHGMIELRKASLSGILLQPCANTMTLRDANSA